MGSGSQKLPDLITVLNQSYELGLADKNGYRYTSGDQLLTSVPDPKSNGKSRISDPDPGNHPITDPDPDPTAELQT